MSTVNQVMLGSAASAVFFFTAVLLVAKWRRPPVPYALRSLSGASDAGPRAERSPLGNALGLVARVPIPEAVTARLGQQRAQDGLLAAGEPYQLTGLAFIRLKLVIQALTFLAFLALTLGALLTQGLVLVFAICYGGVALALWFLPNVWIKERVHGRTADLNHAVPDLIDLLAASVDGGIALDKALRAISASFPDPLGGELKRTIGEIEKGLPSDIALSAMAERTGASELRRFVRPYMQALEQGGKATDHLREISYDMRERRKLQAKEGGEKAEKQMLMPMMLCMLPTVFILELGPALISFFSSIQGK